MSDPTKKSIIINQSFLSGSNKGMSSSGNNKLSKKNRAKLSDEIIKPNKLKKMLLDKINAKRKAEQTSATSSITASASNTNTDINISKESKIFSSEFKKSMDFLDNYINTKNQNPKIKRANDNPQSKTLKRQNIGSGSLTTDILKSLQNSKHSQQQPQQPLQQQRNPSPIYTPTMLHPNFVTQPQIVTPSINIRAPSPNIHAPIFQKIQLQIPAQSHYTAAAPTHTHTHPKINFELGKSSPGNMIYTELPPELQPTVAPIHTNTFIDTNIMPNSITLNAPTTHITGEIQEIQEIINNQETDYEDSYKNNNDDANDDIIGKTSLTTSTTTFSPVKLFDDAPYGCLKNGKKPTFRAYNKTIKHNFRFNDDSNNENPHTERQSKLKELQDKHKRKSSLNTEHNEHSEHNEHNEHSEHNEHNEHNEHSEHNDVDSETGDDKSHNKTQHISRTKLRRHLRKTITKKFKLGKQGDMVGVLIKNNDTRKNIQREHGLLKNKKLSDVKKYLVEKNLIKIGSMAPPNIVRKIYEDAMLTGEIENIGKGVILHNFLEDKKSW